MLYLSEMHMKSMIPFEFIIVEEDADGVLVAVLLVIVIRTIAVEGSLVAEELRVN